MLKWFRAMGQSLSGRLQRAEARSSASQMTFRTDSSFGNAPRFFVTFRS